MLLSPVELQGFRVLFFSKFPDWNFFQDLCRFHFLVRQSSIEDCVRWSLWFSGSCIIQRLKQEDNEVVSRRRWEGDDSLDEIRDEGTQDRLKTHVRRQEQNKISTDSVCESDWLRCEQEADHWEKSSYINKMSLSLTLISITFTFQGSCFQDNVHRNGMRGLPWRNKDYTLWLHYFCIIVSFISLLLLLSLCYKLSSVMGSFAFSVLSRFKFCVFWCTFSWVNFLSIIEFHVR